MKKNLSIIIAFVMLLSGSTAYCQAYPEVFQQPDPIVQPDPIMMSGINTYRLSAPPAEKKTYEQIGLGMDSVYYDTPVDKASAGFINATTSWADIPAKIAEVSEKNNIFLGVTAGFGEGLVSGVARGASGVADMATFGVPPYDKPLMEPQYKVVNPDEGFKVHLLNW